MNVQGNKDVTTHDFERYFIIAWIFLILLLLVYYISFQEYRDIYANLGGDGFKYLSMYEYFRHGVAVDVSHPFCNRPGLPFLTSFFQDAQSGFKYINFVFTIAAFLLIIYICFMLSNRNIKATVVFVTSLYVLFVSGPVRTLSFYPEYTDPPFIFGLALSVVFYVKGWVLFSLGALVLAIPFREAAIYIIPIMAFGWAIRQGICRQFIYKCILIFVSSIMIYGVSTSIFECSGDQISDAFGWLIEIKNSFRFIIVLSGTIMAIGPAVIVMAGSPLTFVKNIFTQRMDYSIFLASSIALAAFGGSDVTRIIFSFFPFFLPFILQILSVCSKLKIYIGVSSIFIIHQFWALCGPTPNNPLPDSGLHMFARTPDPYSVPTAIIILAIFGLFFIASWYLEKRFSR